MCVSRGGGERQTTAAGHHGTVSSSVQLHERASSFSNSEEVEGKTERQRQRRQAGQAAVRAAHHTRLTTGATVQQIIIPYLVL